MNKLPLSTEVPLYDLTSGLTFKNTLHAAEYFGVSKTTIIQYANGRMKKPKFTFRLKYLAPFKKRENRPRLK